MMSFTESVKSTLTTNYAKFSGRASRSEFWWFHLFYYIVFGVLGLITVIAAASFSSLSGPASPMGPGGAVFVIMLIIFAIVALGFFLPTLGLMVRRLHDRNISGWFLLLFFVLNFIPFVGFISAIVLLVFFCLEGTQGPNKFGAAPLRPATVADVFV